MTGKTRLSGGFLGVALLAAAELACVAAIEIAVMAPAEAQYYGNDGRQIYRQRPQRQQGGGGGFFDNLFGRPRAPVYQEPQFERAPPQQQQQVDSSRAPSPRKSDGPPPTTSVVVMGDAMADWLAYGLEEAFADAPEIGIVRKNKPYSGLLRYDAKTDQDWWHMARELLAPEKPNYVIMMLGVSDRQSIRASDLAKAAEKKEAEAPAANATANATPGAGPADADAEGETTIAAPEPPAGRRITGTVEFRTDQWASIYSKRIDDTIGALRSKGVPVFWVGLPSIRGARSTADAVYLNDLYRARAQRAGAIYIDVWDGFVDENGRFATFGPDFEGQRRRLRSGDGVFFSQAGARKLAHYVERELRRHMSNRVPVALPSGPLEPLPDGQSAARPLAGPVVPLTTPVSAGNLLGGAGSRPALIDATATRVLVKGQAVDAPAGRADDFIWPPGSARTTEPAAVTVPAAAAAASASVPAAPSAVPPAATSYTEPPVAAPRPVQPQVDPKAAAKSKQTPSPAAPRAVEARPRPQAAAPPRPPQPVRPSGPFDWFR
ncbi:MAG: SGNH family hydrolase [Pseudolabrys sp.]|nr:SGNH family hydrolase [Pseudolabrys sp.]